MSRPLPTNEAPAEAMNGGGRYGTPGVDVPFDAAATDGREDGPERNGLATPTDHRTAAGDLKKRKPAKKGWPNPFGGILSFFRTSGHHACVHACVHSWL